MSNFEKGDRVMTPGGVGTVYFKRMAPPNYSEVEAYSVKLDKRANDPHYAGSMFFAAEVKEHNE